MEKNGSVICREVEFLIFFNVLKLYFYITILIEIGMLVNRMQFNLSYTIGTKNLVHGLLQKTKTIKRICNLVFHLLKMYVRFSIKCC